MSVDLLLVEDEPLDVELIGDALRRAGVEPRLRCVDDEPGFRSSLALKRPDAILADWTLPSFSGARALEIARLEFPEVPFLFVSGTIAEHTALEALRNGAVDYVYKHQLERLASSVSRAIDEARERRALATSEERYRRLFETAKDGILILAAESGRILEANPFISRLLGCEPQDLIGKQLWEIGSLIDKERAIHLFSELQERGYVRYEDLPLRSHDGSLKEVEFVSNTYLVGDQEVIQCNIRDISDRRAAERLAHTHQEETLRGLQDMVVALVSLSEARDPYTAGHQERVADLAAAMAVEMGLVRTHVQAGVDVLQPIHFPWPVAETVLHHHERLDGSGYPQHLQGEAISLGGRILAVADTVEAMATHRPYRFSQGLEAALTTIEAGKASLYDPAAVEACLRLFRQKGYQLSNPRSAVSAVRTG